MTQTINENVLLRLHQDVVKDALARSTIQSKHVRLFQAGPGHFDHTAIFFPNIDLSLDKMSADCRRTLASVSEKISLAKGGRFRALQSPDSPFQPSICGSLVSGIYESYFRSSIEKQEGFNWTTFDTYARSHSAEILSWLDYPESEIYLRCLSTPRISAQQGAMIDRWSFYYPNWIELSRFAQTSWHSGQEGLTRALEVTWMETKLEAAERNDQSTVLSLAERICLAITLGAAQPLLLEDASIVTKPWSFAPDRPQILNLKMANPSWSHPAQASSVRFHASTFLRGAGVGNFTELLDDSQLQLSAKWHSILTRVPEAMFSFSNIFRGIWAILGSHYTPSVRQSSVSLTGLFDFVSGMDGLISKCKEIGKGGYPINVAKTFCDVWEKIWSQKIQRGSGTTKLQPVNNLNETLKKLYSLRSDIAHSDPGNLKISLKEVKTAFGDSYNPGSHDPNSVGMCVVQRLFPVLDEFVSDPNLLPNLFKGIRP